MYQSQTAADETSVWRPNFGCTSLVSIIFHTFECVVTYLPEINNDLVVLSVTTVIGVLLPVIDINIGDTTNQQLEFSLVKDIDQVRGDQLVEAGKECVELLLNSLLNTPFGDEAKRLAQSRPFREVYSLNVFLLVLVGDFNLLTSRFQFNADSFTKSLIISAKRKFKRIGNVVVPGKC